MKLFSAFGVAMLFTVSFVSAAYDFDAPFKVFKGKYEKNKEVADKCIEQLNKKEVRDTLYKIKDTDPEVHREAIAALKKLFEDGKYVKAKDPATGIPHGFITSANDVQDRDADAATTQAFFIVIVSALMEYEELRTSTDADKFEFPTDLYGECLKILAKALKDAKNLKDADKETLKVLIENCRVSDSILWLWITLTIIALVVVVSAVVFFVIHRK